MQNPLRGALYYYISNEKDYDTLFVQRAFRLHWEFLKSKALVENAILQLVHVTKF